MVERKHEQTRRLREPAWFRAEELRERLYDLPRILTPRPNHESVWLQFLFIFFFMVLQVIVAPAMTMGWLSIDLLTTWLVMICVFQPYFYGLACIFVVSIALETYSTAPIGLYFCVYWIMLNLIHYFRENLSWRHGTPWLVVLATSLSVVTLFELGFFIVQQTQVHLHLDLVLVKIAELVLSLGIGFLMAEFYSRTRLEVDQK